MNLYALLAVSGIFISAIGTTFFILLAEGSDHPAVCISLAIASFITGFVMLGVAINLDENAKKRQAIEECVAQGGSYIDEKTGQCYDESRRLINTDLVPVTG
jgi:hypothetical protein